MWDIWTSAEFWSETGVFLYLVLGSLGLALLAGVPLGIGLAVWKGWSTPVIGSLGLLQTLPSLALLGILIPLLGIGQPAVVFLAVLYSLFPVVMNTFVGITQVPASVRDAARGMGMTTGQILRQVDLPLALPVVLAGVRAGAVYAIGMITIGALAGVRGLGWYIVRGMNRSNNTFIAAGAIPLLLLTVLVFLGLGALARLSRRNSQAGLTLGGALVVALALQGCWVMGSLFAPQAAAKDSVRIASKNFVEGEILTEICKQMLQAHTDLDVQVVPNLAPNLIFRGLKNGEFDLYPEYTGVLLMNQEALGLPVPADRSTITRVVRDGMLRKHDMVLLETFGLNNTYAFCTTKEYARRHDLKTLSDLGRVPDARIVVDLDFLDRDDGWKGLVKTYGFSFPPPPQLTPDLRYAALKKGADVILGFATDWEIEAFDLVVLEDDKGYFPSYHGAPLVRKATLDHHPEIATLLNRLKDRIDDRTMRRLNFQVAREGQSEAAVARAFLQEQGLLEH
jgi:osmoprotectant transport system permease protein